MSSPGSDSDKILEERSVRVREYLELPESFRNRSGEAGNQRSTLNIDTTGKKLELHVLRAVDTEQLKADTFAVCSRLLSEGFDVIPVYDLSPESIESPGDRPAINLIWEGKFGDEFSSSRFMSGLMKGSYSSKLKKRIIIVAMSWTTFENFFSRKEKTVEETEAVPGPMGLNIKIGLFLLGIAMLMSVALPMLPSTVGKSLSGSTILTGDISLASTVAGFILIVAGLISTGFPQRRKVYGFIIALMLVYIVSISYLWFQPVDASAFGVIAFGTVYFVASVIFYFLILLMFTDFRKSFVLYAAAGTAFAYVLYMSLTAYFNLSGTSSALLNYNGVFPGYSLIFSFSLHFLNYSTLSNGNILTLILFIASALLFSAYSFWAAFDFEISGEGETGEEDSEAAAT